MLSWFVSRGSQEFVLEAGLGRWRAMAPTAHLGFGPGLYAIFCVTFTHFCHGFGSIVQEVVEGPSQNLLESVAHLIANTILMKFPQISAVRVKVGKPHVAVRGPVDYLGVDIIRYREVDKPKFAGTSFMI